MLLISLETYRFRDNDQVMRHHTTEEYEQTYYAREISSLSYDASHKTPA